MVNKCKPLKFNRIKLTAGSGGTQAYKLDNGEVVIWKDSKGWFVDSGYKMLKSKRVSSLTSAKRYVNKNFSRLVFELLVSFFSIGVKI